jgi:hypothetical protein
MLVKVLLIMLRLFTTVAATPPGSTLEPVVSEVPTVELPVTVDDPKKGMTRILDWRSKKIPDCQGPNPNSTPTETVPTC